LVAAYLPRLGLALLTLAVGWWGISVIGRLLRKVMEEKQVDETLRPFLLSMSSMLLKVLLVISVASMVGVEMTSFIAVMGAAGLAVGLSLQGSLSNFAGGVLILLFKPFKVGDYIEAQGHSGKVHSIQVFATVLKTPDNKTVIIPNGALSNGSVINYTMEDTRRVDFVFGIGYDDDIDKARGVINDVVKKDKRILKNPAVFIKIGELADSSVNFFVRLWVKTDDYWDVYFDVFEDVKKAFDKKGIGIPFPQMDVHLKKE
jgi:small conductance mechanosensitive channel